MLQNVICDLRTSHYLPLLEPLLSDSENNSFAKLQEFLAASNLVAILARYFRVVQVRRDGQFLAIVMARAQLLGIASDAWLSLELLNRTIMLMTFNLARIACAQSRRRVIRFRQCKVLLHHLLCGLILIHL